MGLPALLAFRINRLTLFALQYTRAALTIQLARFLPHSSGSVYMECKYTTFEDRSFRVGTKLTIVIAPSISHDLQEPVGNSAANLSE